MSIAELVNALNTAAMVLGYLVLILLVAFVCWVAGAWYDKWAYNRRRKRKHDLEWDNIRSKWLDEYIPIQRVQTAEHTVIDSVDRIDTAVLDQTVDDIYDYQEELRRDAS